MENQQKVYVVSQCDGPCCRVVRVFATKTAAEWYVAGQKHPDEYEIDEYDVEE